MSAILLCAALAFAGELHVQVRGSDGDWLVDAAGTSVRPDAFLRRVAVGAEKRVRGDELLAGADTVDVHLEGRALETVLRALALATDTVIAFDADSITVAPAREDVKGARRDGAGVESLERAAQAAWLRLAREFPDHEAARAARLELGRAQERLGHDEAALAHYDAAVRSDVTSPAMDRALQAASDLLWRRGDYGEAQRRLSQLAVHAADPALRCSARIATARALALQGRGPEALGLLDAIELSFPPRDDRDGEERRLVRARAELASGNPSAALLDLDRRAVAHAALGLTSEDLELRARALDSLGATLEASRAWLACASLSSGRAKQDALASALRLSAAGGDALGVIFIAKLADEKDQSDADRAIAKRLVAEARERLALEELPGASMEALASRWQSRARLAPSDRAALAARCIQSAARTHSIDEALQYARTAITELDGADPALVRGALAESYERRGMWSQAAALWNGAELPADGEGARKRGDQR
jgi:hypothetical protein